MSRASTPSPFHDGFAALRHEPALLAAELAWRWCFGFSALVLVAVSTGLYLDSVNVSRADQFLLSTLQPPLLAEALRDIFRGSLSRLLLEQAVLVFGLTLLWSFASAAGRAAILRRLVAMFSTSDEPQSTDWHFRSIFLLHLMRAMWTQVAIVVAVALLIFGSVMASNRRPLAAAFSIAFGVGFAALIGFYLNWYLGLAPLFCIRNNVDARDAVDQAVAFSTEHGGRLLLMGNWFFPAAYYLGGGNVAGVSGTVKFGSSDRRPLGRVTDGDCGFDLLCRRRPAAPGAVGSLCFANLLGAASRLAAG